MFAAFVIRECKPLPTMRPTISWGHSNTCWPCPGPIWPSGRVPLHRYTRRMSKQSWGRVAQVHYEQSVGGASGQARELEQDAASVYYNKVTLVHYEQTGRGASGQAREREEDAASV